MGKSSPDPREAVIRLTNACNARCRMCSLWEEKEISLFDAALLQKLPAGLKSISLSGGEPFLRNDLAEIVARIKDVCPKSRIVISTNGILTETINMQMEKIIMIEPEIAVRISVDGVGDVHDKIRGVKDAYLRVMATLKRLKKLKVRDLGIAMTVTDFNVEEMDKVYQISRQEKVKFNCQVVHNSEFYYRKNNNVISQGGLLKKILNKIILSELKSWRPQALFKTYYYKGIWEHVNYLPRLYPCNAGNLFFYLDQEGKVYPCQFLNRGIGNLHKESFSAIWNSKEACQVREELKKCGVNCWTVCTAAPAIKDKPFRAARWVFINKLKAHLGASNLL